MRLPSFKLGILLACCWGCGGDAAKAPAPAASPPPPAPVVHAPPSFSYVPATAWVSREDPNITVAPPDPAKETWRVFSDQRKPMQKPTPVWRPLPANETVAVQLQPESGFRCIVTPLEVSSESNDFGTKLKAWILTRKLLCSGDQWRSWTEHPHSVRVAPDGARTTTLAAEALLREQNGAEPRETMVLVRDDEERRAATTGPPQIVPGLRGVDID